MSLAFEVVAGIPPTNIFLRMLDNFLRNQQFRQIRRFAYFMLRMHGSAASLIPAFVL